MDHVPEILFVDDNPGDGDLVEEAFRQYEVPARFTKAGSGSEALAMLRAAVEAGDPLPELVLLDVNLPGMSGHDVLRAIRSDPALSELEVVMISASDFGGDIEQSERQEAAYVIKPANWDEYLVLVRSFQQRLKERSQPAEAEAVPAESGPLAPPPVLKGLAPESDEA